MTQRITAVTASARNGATIENLAKSAVEAYSGNSWSGVVETYEMGWWGLGQVVVEDYENKELTACKRMISGAETPEHKSQRFNHNRLTNIYAFQKCPPVFSKVFSHMCSLMFSLICSLARRSVHCRDTAAPSYRSVHNHQAESFHYHQKGRAGQGPAPRQGTLVGWQLAC